MNKKISIGMVVGLMFIVILATSSITITITSNQYNEILEDLPDKIEKYDVLDELDNIISKNYYNEDAEEMNIEAMAQGYLEGLSDGECEYFSAEEYVTYLAQTQGQMDGIGIEAAKSSTGDMKVTAVYDGSPADEAGLEVGDIIIAFDGVEVNVSNYDEMLEKVQGNKLSTVNLTYQSDDEEFTIDVVQGYEEQSVKVEIYDTVGYIEISNFYSTTATEIQAAIDMFIASGIQDVVIDVRENSSVNYDYAIQALDIFVPMTETTTPAMQVIGYDDNVLQTYETTAGEVNLSTIILISSKTEAAAELFACNMRDFSKAELLGSSTAGDGLMQEVFELSSGSAVLLTTGKILAYKSDCFEGSGLEPDYEIIVNETSESIEEDSQFLQAVAILTQE